MRYWVYINDKVDGPFEEDKLVTLQGFTPQTLICSEEVAAGGSQEWVKASSVFEFDQVETAAAAAHYSAAQTTAHEMSNITTEDLNRLLLEKIDILTQEMTGLQSKLDTMQTKLDEAIESAQNARLAASPDAPAYIPPQEDAQNTITLTRHELVEDPSVNEEALITNTESLVNQAEDLVAQAQQQEKPLDMLGPVDPSATTEVSLGSKAEEAVVLRSALDSLYNARTIQQTQEEKESTFQDLLTPKQAQELAAQAEAKKAEANKPTLEEMLENTENTIPAVEETPKETVVQETADEVAKDALISELTAEPKEDLLDLVIKEREEEEKKEETLRMAAAAAAAGAVAGAAAVAGLDAITEDKKEEIKEDAPGFETVAEAATEPLPENKTLDFTEETRGPALTIAADPAEPEKQEEVKPAEEMPADQPQAEEKPTQAEEPNEALPSISDMDKPQLQEEGDAKEETVQELIPGAEMEKPEGVLITDSDLNEAFSERNTQEDQSVEQLFGVATAAGAAVNTHEEDQAQETAQNLPQFAAQTADKPLPVGNPNDLTEIELKEGSTYLISDFVPPAQTPGNKALPKELSGLEDASAITTPAEALEQPAEDTATTELQEMVGAKTQTEKKLETPEDLPGEVTVSQVILENTIKTKRGASLDIKTVPMVPEPAQSDRLHIEGLDDDINAQHDLKSADVKSATSTTKAVIGILVALVLASLIYAMLAFMNLIPPQFNLLKSKETAAVEQVAEQNAQMEEMLGETVTVPEADPAAAEQPLDPMEAIKADVQNFPLINGYTLKAFIEAKHPAASDLITWEISTAVDPDNYSVLVKVPPENPQSFKISYRFNYNTLTKELNPTISDAKNLLDSAAQGPLPQLPASVPAEQAQVAVPAQPLQQAAQ